MLLAAERGYQAMTTEQVAEAAGVSHRTLFRRDASKEELVLGGLLRGGRAIVHHPEDRLADEPVERALCNRSCSASTRSGKTSTTSRAWRTTVLEAPELLERLALNFGTALRQKWNPWFEFFFWLPLPLLGVPPYAIYWVFGFNLVYPFFSHTERVGKLWRPVELVMNAPSHHRDVWMGAVSAVVNWWLRHPDRSADEMAARSRRLIEVVTGAPVTGRP